MHGPRLAAGLGLWLVATFGWSQTGSAPDLQPAAGEIRLDGLVRSVEAAQRRFVMDVRVFALPSGRSRALPSAKPKMVIVGRRAVVRLEGVAALGELRPGMEVAVVGRDLGAGRHLPARMVVLQPPPVVVLEDGEGLEKKISLQLKEADIRDVLETLANEAGVNVVVQRTVPAHRVSLNVRNATVEQVLQLILDQYRLAYSIESDIYIIEPIPPPPPQAGGPRPVYVLLRNGDRLSGQVAGLEEGRLTLDSALVGTLTLRTADIAELAIAESVGIRFQDGRVVTGRILGADEGRFRIDQQGSRPPATFAWKDVVAIESPAPVAPPGQ